MESSSQKNENLARKPQCLYIYTEGELAATNFSKLQDLLKTCVGLNCYTINKLQLEGVVAEPWSDNAALLLIVAEEVSQLIATCDSATLEKTFRTQFFL